MRSTPVTLPDNTDTVNPPSKQAVFADRAADFIELVKPRLVVMILITTAAGFYLGAQQTVNWLQMLAYTSWCRVDGGRGLRTQPIS